MERNLAGLRHALLPLEVLAGVVADANGGRREGEHILLSVDGVHGFGVEDASPVELGVDIFASGCHKWLFGPRGTGLLWAAPPAWARLAPTIPSFDPRAYLAWSEGRRPTDAPSGALMAPGGFPLVRAPLVAAGGARAPPRLGRRAEVAGLDPGQAVDELRDRHRVVASRTRPRTSTAPPRRSRR